MGILRPGVDSPEELSFNLGALDLFPLHTGNCCGTPNLYPPVVATTGLVMSYYDGNTVTALWNYAQHYALNDNSYGSTFGPSTVGAINLISGQTNGVVSGTAGATPSSSVPDTQGGFTLIGDADPEQDVCSSTTGDQVTMTGNNIGDLLNDHGISWGGFMGGFNLQTINANGSKGCGRTSSSDIIASTNDYVPHHMWFQYYASTANPQHVRPTKPIGESDAANHGNYVIIPQRRIAEALGISRNTVSANLQRLEPAGAITIESLYNQYGGRLPNKYRLKGKQGNG